MSPPPTGGAVVVIQQQQSQGRGDRPIGVMILSILYIIVGIGIAFGALLFLIGGAFVQNFSDAAPDWLGSLLTAAALFIALSLAVLSALVIWICVGNLRGSAWAWTMVIVLQTLFLFFGILGMFSGEPGAVGENIVGVLIAGLIIWYYYTADVKRFFGKGNTRALWQRRG